MKIKKISFVIIFIIIFTLIYVSFNTNIWKNNNKIIAWDVIHYYVYLPATFIYHDLTLDFVDLSGLPQ